jgi:hypothetical protein
MAETCCELCGRTLQRMEPLYIATIEIRPTTAIIESDEDPGDRDHLNEIDEMLETVDLDVLAEMGDDTHKSELLLCHDCCRRFRDQPEQQVVPRDLAAQLSFSEN